MFHLNVKKCLLSKSKYIIDCSNSAAVVHILCEAGLFFEKNIKYMSWNVSQVDNRILKK